MNRQVSDEIGMFIYDLQLLTCVVIVYSDFSIVCSDYDPLLPGYKFSASHWSIGNFEWSDLSLLIIVEQGHIACIETDQDPWEGWMQFYTLYSLRSAK